MTSPGITVIDAGLSDCLRDPVSQPARKAACDMIAENERQCVWPEQKCVVFQQFKFVLETFVFRPLAIAAVQ